MSAQAAIIDLIVELARLDRADEIIELFATEAVALLGADRVSVALIDHEDPSSLIVASVNGVDRTFGSGSRVSLSRSPIGRPVITGEAATWSTAPKPGHEPDPMYRIGIADVMSAPITSGHGCHGSLNAGYLSTSSRPSLGLIVQLGQLLASQLDRVESNEQLEREIDGRERRVGRLMALHGIERRLSVASDMRGVLRVLAGSVFELVAAERVSYASCDPERSESVVYAVTSLGAVTEGATLPLDAEEFAATWADRVYLYNDDHETSTEPFLRDLAQEGVRSSINLGVFVDGGCVGTVNVGCAVRDGLDADDRALLTTLASFMGSTLERIAAHEELIYQAHHDVLTGLLRRDRFEEALDQEIERLQATGGLSAVCFIDLDRFKLVNDTQGHLVGDRLLTAVAECLESCLDSNDVLGRLGGDEFALLLRGRNASAYAQTIAGLVEAIAEMDIVANHTIVSASVSIGWALIDDATTSARDAIGESDAACYVAKRQGGGVAIRASVRDQAQAERRNAGQLVNLIRDALERDRFVLFAQPLRALTRSGVSGFEVLIRLQEDDGRYVPPSQFIPAAERYGVIADVDLWVCRETIGALRRARAAGTLTADTQVFVNVSANSIASPAFVDDFSRLIGEVPELAARLCVEITESGTMGNLDAAVRFIAAIRAYGTSVALDDFGAGFSSLGALQHLPVDYLKIDGSLVDGIEHDRVNSALVSAVVTLADAVGMTTIAEHIESAAALEAVTSLGVSTAQGFFLGHPAPLERLLDLAPRPSVASGRAVGLPVDE